MLTSVLLALSLAAAPTDTAPAIDPRTLYPRLFRLAVVAEASYEGIALRVDSLPLSDPLAPLVNANLLYFDYLAEHATTPELSGLVARRLAFPTLQVEYAALLRRDPGFNRLMAETVGRFATERGASVQGFDLQRPRPRVRMEDVMDVAVRFFYPDAILPDGGIQTHICIDLNGVRDAQRPRDLALEAFAFAAIQDEAKHGRYGLREDFVRVRDRMNSAGLLADPAVRLTRAQGFMWARMAQSPALRETLRAAYAARAAYLPFVVEDAGLDETGA